MSKEPLLLVSPNPTPTTKAIPRLSEEGRLAAIAKGKSDLKRMAICLLCASHGHLKIFSLNGNRALHFEKHHTANDAPASEEQVRSLLGITQQPKGPGLRTQVRVQLERYEQAVQLCVASGTPVVATVHEETLFNPPIKVVEIRYMQNWTSMSHIIKATSEPVELPTELAMLGGRELKAAPAWSQAIVAALLKNETFKAWFDGVCSAQERRAESGLPACRFVPGAGLSNMLSVLQDYEEKSGDADTAAVQQFLALFKLERDPALSLHAFGTVRNIAFNPNNADTTDLGREIIRVVQMLCLRQIRTFTDAHFLAYLLHPGTKDSASKTLAIAKPADELVRLYEEFKPKPKSDFTSQRSPQDEFDAWIKYKPSQPVDWSRLEDVFPRVAHMAKATQLLGPSEFYEERLRFARAQPEAQERPEVFEQWMIVGDNADAVAAERSEEGDGESAGEDADEDDDEQAIEGDDKNSSEPSITEHGPGTNRSQHSRGTTPNGRRTSSRGEPPSLSPANKDSAGPARRKRSAPTSPNKHRKKKGKETGDKRSARARTLFAPPKKCHICNSNEVKLFKTKCCGDQWFCETHPGGLCEEVTEEEEREGSG